MSKYLNENDPPDDRCDVCGFHSLPVCNQCVRSLIGDAIRSLNAAVRHPEGDGGPIFPSPSASVGDAKGMSLRDWFAGQALVCLAEMRRHGSQAEEVAKLAWDLAEAMIAEGQRRC